MKYFIFYTLLLSCLFIIHVHLLPSQPMIGFQSPISTCFKNDSDCVNCPANSTINFTSQFVLTTHPEFVYAAYRAQSIIEEYPGIIKLEGLYELHTAINYFCCLTAEEKKIIFKVLASLEWNSIELNYTDFGCNVDHNGIIVYIHAKPDEESQKKLFAFTDTVQEAIAAAGVHIINPRQQTFHMTLARVNHTYPTDDVVRRLTHEAFGGGTVWFSWFEIDGTLFFAKDFLEKKLN